MLSGAIYRRLDNWTEKQQSNGRLSFSLKELRETFKNDSETALKQLLERLVTNKKILSVFKGYYIIIPPQYAAKGILPPTLFIDGLMKYLERIYYIGLLNAAAIHGAGHQQPQEYFVITEYPVLRPTGKKGIKINYISTRQFPPDVLIEKKKTETGNINISNPILTVVDLINYEKRIGGLNRAVTIINELLDGVNPKDITRELIAYANTTTIQRLGFILENILGHQMLADKFLSMSKKAGIKFYQIPLKASGDNKKAPINEKWKVVVNTEIDFE